MASATVQHGRRKGKSASNSNNSRPEFNFNKSDLDIRSVKVLTRADFDRIQKQVHRRELEEQERQRIRDEREDLKKRSEALIKNWGNTVLGARQKKLAERAARLAREEEERKAIDIEEEIYRAAERRQAIEKAKIQQYYQTDRVKNFHSALLLTETLKEREAQLELKRLRRLAENDAASYEAWNKEYEEALRKDQEKVEERNRKNRETAEYQKFQKQKVQEERNRSRLEHLQEGDEIRRLAQAHALEAQRLDQIREMEQKQLLQNNLQQINDVRRMREIEKLKEAEEEEECRLFAAAKKKMIRLRLEKESEMHRQKQESLEKIKAKLSAQLEAMVNDEEERTEFAVREREDKLNMEEAEKAANRQKMLQSITDHRTTQMRREEEARLKRHRDEMLAVQARQEADRLFRENEMIKKEKQLRESRRVAEYQLKQAELNSTSAHQQRLLELKYDEENLKSVEQEENQFQDYAKRVIEHCEKNGRNVYPLKKAAVEGAGGGLGPQFPGRGGVRPSYQTADSKCIQLPHFKRDSTEAVKSTIDNQESTHNRLGFVWS